MVKYGYCKKYNRGFYTNGKVKLYIHKHKNTYYLMEYTNGSVSESVNIMKSDFMQKNQLRHFAETIL